MMFELYILDRKVQSFPTLEHALAFANYHSLYRATIRHNGVIIHTIYRSFMP